MEQQVLKAINHIKYVSKKGVTISGIQRFLKKKSTTTFDETSVGEIICEMQQNGKIDGKFKIINPIYDDKNFAEDPLEIHPKTCNDKSYISEESVDTASINSNHDNYSATLLVSDLRSETKDSRFESGCELYAEVSFLQQSPG